MPWEDSRSSPPFCLWLVAGHTWFSREDWKSKEAELANPFTSDTSSTQHQRHHVHIAIPKGERFGPNLPLDRLALLPKSFSLLWLDFERPHLTIGDYLPRNPPLPPSGCAVTPFQTIWITLRGCGGLDWDYSVLAPLKQVSSPFWATYFPSLQEVVIELEIDPLDLTGVSERLII